MTNWPPEFNLPADHCADVLAGCYDLPIEPLRILDIGANVGAFARWASNRWPNAVIYSYEPQPENFSRLMLTVEAMGLKRVIPHKAAISDADGTMTLHENGNCGEWSFIHFEPKFTGSVEVSVWDAKKLPDADFIKIDTEGAEPNIVKRMLETGHLLMSKGLVLEYHAAVHVAPLIWFAEQAGLKLHAIVPAQDHRGLLKFLR